MGRLEGTGAIDYAIYRVIMAPFAYRGRPVSGCRIMPNFLPRHFPQRKYSLISSNSMP